MRPALVTSLPRRRAAVYLALTLALATPWVLRAWRPWEPSPLLWRQAAGGEFLGGPVVGEGRVFLATSDQRVRCLSWPGRDLLWEAAVPGVPGASPVFDPVSEQLFVTTMGAALVALDARTGVVEWTRFLTPTARFRAAPVCDATALYLGARDGWVYALDKATGRHRWQVFAGAAVHRDPALADGTVFVGTERGTLLALDARTGAERWCVRTGGAIHGAPAAAEGAVFVGSQDKHLYAVDAATGRLLWRFRAWHEITSRPAVVGDRVVFGSWDHHLICVERTTGRLIWRFHAGDVIEGSPLVAGDAVYFGSWDGGIYAVDLATGALRWRHQTGTWVTATPVLGPAGEQVLAGGEDAVLYGLRL